MSTLAPWGPRQQGARLVPGWGPLPEPAPLTTEQLLVSGGDARIAIDPVRGANRYGCRPLPDPGLDGFGSSTASVISAAGFAAAEGLRRRLFSAARMEAPAVTYARELGRVRRELLALCGLSALPEPAVVFAASGTDLHLLAAQLAGEGGAGVPLVIVAAAAETGSGVPAALGGRHFSTRSALGAAVAEGEPLEGLGAVEVVTVPVRLADGAPRPALAVDAEVEALVEAAAQAARRVLLIVVDQSKTGLLAPSPERALALRRRWPGSVEVLVDACQFRLAPATLRAYLAADLLVALSGSKFLTGPTFSGALLVPAPAARRLRGRPVPRALAAYSARADWPPGWAAAASLDDVANFGLLLRWEAALQELRAFQAVPAAEVARFLGAFARAVEERLRRDPRLEPVPVPRLDRRPLCAGEGWDTIQTIFPFLLRSPGRGPLSGAETLAVYQALQADQLGDGAARCQLGQPVACGVRGGVPVSALRLCASSRLVVEGAARGGPGAAGVIDRALAALDRAARTAAR